jgi:pimeloyl-ACP methyl ester carboxylesterase
VPGRRRCWATCSPGSPRVGRRSSGSSGGIGLGAALDDGRIADEAIEAYRAVLSHTDTLGNDIALGRLFLSPVRGMDPRILLGAAERGRITVPVAFQWGDRDPFGGSAVARAFAEPFPDATLDVVEGVGHAPWMDDPARAAAFASSFLAQREVGAA